MIEIKRIYPEYACDDVAQINYKLNRNDLFVMASEDDTIFVTDKYLDLQRISAFSVPDYFEELNKKLNLKPGIFKKNVLTHQIVDKDYVIIIMNKHSISTSSSRVVKYNDDYFHVACNLKLIKEIGDINLIRDYCRRKPNEGYVEINEDFDSIVTVCRPDISGSVLYNENFSRYKSASSAIMIKIDGDIRVVTFEDNRMRVRRDSREIDLFNFGGSDDDYETMIINNPKCIQHGINKDLIDRYVSEIPARIHELEYIPRAKQKGLKYIPKK